MKEWFYKIFLALLAVLAPVQATLITVGILIFMDLIMGVAAAHKRGEKITSAGLRRSVTKFLVYQCAVLSAFMVEVYLIGGIIPVVKLVAGVIGLTELKSLLEKSYELTGTDFKSIISKLGSINDKNSEKKE